MTTAILFLIILAILVFVHELGHFVVAKAFGIRVDEFGLGFPPRLLSKKVGETIYSINAVPFGGFVKIFGENPDEESISGPDSARSFVNKNRGIQAAVLVAGVTCNALFAWLLFSLGFMVGLPVSAQDAGSNQLQNVHLAITEVLPNSPAEIAGFQAGDSLILLQAGTDVAKNLTPDSVKSFVESHSDSKILVTTTRGGKSIETSVTPASGVTASGKSIGIAMDSVGILRLPFFQAFARGGETAVSVIQEITLGLVKFIAQIFHGTAGLAGITGPIGIAHIVGEARALGYIYVLTFTAFISINLAVLNLMPFPALDGGRLLFVLIEAIFRRPIKPRIANVVNGVGFALLIALMVVVTYRDIIKLF